MVLHTPQAVNITGEHDKTPHGKYDTLREIIGSCITALMGMCFLICALVPLTTGSVNQLLRVAFFVLFGCASILGLLYAVASLRGRKMQSMC